MKFAEGRYGRMLLVFGLGILVSLLVPIQVTDSSHETLRVGGQWFGDGVIPLVQSYSHYGPLSLWFAHLWGLVAPEILSSYLLDAVFGGSIALMLWKLTGFRTNNPQVRLGFVVLFMSAAVGSGALEHGPSPLKLGLTLALASILGYMLWRKSSRSYWLFGETEHNWRYLLVSGISAGMLLFTEHMYFVFLLPLGSLALLASSDAMRKKLQTLSFYVVPTLLLSWIWISYFDSRNLLSQWAETIRLHTDYILHDSSDRLGLLVFIPAVIAFCFAFYHARRTNFARQPNSWLLAVVLVVATALQPRIIIFASPLLVLLALYWADHASIRQIGIRTLQYSAVTSGVLIVVLSLAVNRTIRLETGRTELAQSYIEQRLIDTSHVFYYGRGAGFYNDLISPSTSFVDAKVFAYDRSDLGLVDRLRGENEASSPRFVLVGKESLAVDNNDRINDYIETHYEKTVSMDGFDIYKRK